MYINLLKTGDHGKYDSTQGWNTIEEAHEKKLVKYQKLVELWRELSKRALCEETGSGLRYFVGHSICKALTGFGVNGTTINDSTETAEQSARRLSIKKADQQFDLISVLLTRGLT